jgi:hypothetical protein
MSVTCEPELGGGVKQIVVRAHIIQHDGDWVRARGKSMNEDGISVSESGCFVGWCYAGFA